MAIRLIRVQSRRDLRRFIYLAEALHRDHPLWMPPLYSDEWAYFDPRKNRAFSYCDTTLLLAEQDGRLVGRVMALRVLLRVTRSALTPKKALKAPRQSM